MGNKFELKTTIYPSMADREGKLGIPNLFALFMDVATAHAEVLGFGAQAMMNRGLFWLTVKTKVRILSRPRLMEEVQVQTWPGIPDRYRCPRYYRLLRGEEVLAEGKTEWAVMNVQTGGLVPAKEAFADDFPFFDETACDGPFARIGTDFSQSTILDEYRVRSTDIDLGRHMNNVAYLRTVFGAISNDTLRDRQITELDALFKAPCFEGEELKVIAQEGDGYVDVAVVRPDEKPAFLLRLTN